MVVLAQFPTPHLNPAALNHGYSLHMIVRRGAIEQLYLTTPPLYRHPLTKIPSEETLLRNQSRLHLPRRHKKSTLSPTLKRVPLARPICPASSRNFHEHAGIQVVAAVQSYSMRLCLRSDNHSDTATLLDSTPLDDRER